jgi:branched-chain amino acid transport system substrate-binding protein
MTGSMVGSRLSRRRLGMLSGIALSSGLLPVRLSAQEPINLAVIAPMNGSNAVGGEMVVRASKLAVEDINAAGGIHALNGSKLNLIIADSTENAQGAITTTERVLSQQQIAGVFGLVISPLTAAAIPALIKHHVPVITASTADSLVTPANGGYLFMIGPTGSALGRVAVDFVRASNAAKTTNITKAAILYINNAYGQSAQKGVEKLVRESGIDVVLNSAYPENITDASPLVTKVAQSGADVLFPLSNVADAGLILTALHSARSKVLVFGAGSGFTWPPIGQSLGERVDGLFGGAAWNWDMKNVVSDPKLVDVTTRYEKTYGGYMPEQAGEAYGAMWMFALAMEKAASADSEKLRDTLATMKVTSGYPTIVQPGLVEFGANGANPNVKAVMIQWQGGKPRTVFPPELATHQILAPH